MKKHRSILLPGNAGKSYLSEALEHAGYARDSAPDLVWKLIESNKMRELKSLLVVDLEDQLTGNWTRL